MNKISLFYRTAGQDYSIERVFDTLHEEFVKKYALHKICVKYYRISPYNIFYNLYQCHKYRSEVNHITGVIHYCAFSLPVRNTIVTIHDTSFPSSRLKRFFIYLFWFYLPLKRVKYITCISENTRNKLVELCPFLKKKIRVIYNPVNIDYQYSPKLFNEECPSILHIGTRKNKNLERVIEALHGIKCHVRIIGKLNNKQIELLNQYEINYSNVFNLSNTQIVKEYKQCDLVSFPSTFEGFGMPIIEGQAVGRVVLTSNIDPMKEVANNTAFLVDPYKVEQIREGFISLIQNHKLRDRLIESGLENAQHFQPKRIAAQYMNLYEEIIEKSKK